MLSRVLRIARPARRNETRSLKPSQINPSNRVQQFSTSCKEAQQTRSDRKMNIIGLSKEELAKDFEVFRLPSYRVGQVWQWLYAKGASSFSEMSSLSKDLRQQLDNHYHISYGDVTKDSVAHDGTRKFLVGFGEHQVESVFIPETQRGTLCVSSQVGCSLSCTFCHTGTQGLSRNLKAEEIIGQLMNAKKILYDFPTREERTLSNIVFMGQGEPFYNYRNVKKAIDIITDADGLAISRRRITVSTSGVVPNIKKLGDDFPGINLAISLHAPTNKLRSEIVPANKQWPIEELIAACKAFPGLKPHRRITFEYVMLKDVNDSIAQAKQLVELIKDFPSLVNIIPFNPWPGSQYQCSSHDQIVRFAKAVEDAGINAPIRWPRGRDILAACGQLKTEESKKRQDAKLLANSVPASSEAVL